MKILVICHIEPMFFKYISYKLVKDVARYGRLFDRVLVVEASSELMSEESIYEELKPFYNYWCENWVWGFDPENIEEDMEEGQDYIVVQKGGQFGGRIYEWMHNLPREAKYYFVGGGRWECLQTVKEIFDNLGYKNKVVESLTY